MLKVKIINLKEFFNVVNQCMGPVNIISLDGIKKDINKVYHIQEELQKKYKDYLYLELDIQKPKDYMRIVFFSICDC